MSKQCVNGLDAQWTALKGAMYAFIVQFPARCTIIHSNNHRRWHSYNFMPVQMFVGISYSKPFNLQRLLYIDLFGSNI